MRKKRESKAAYRRRSALWRERHPIADAWRCHRWNAKKRCIPCLWTWDEFDAWCQETGYHILRRDGYQIHRQGDAGPYRADRCFCLPAVENRRLQEVHAKIDRRRRLALQCA